MSDDPKSVRCVWCGKDVTTCDSCGSEDVVTDWRVVRNTDRNACTQHLCFTCAGPVEAFRASCGDGDLPKVAPRSHDELVAYARNLDRHGMTEVETIWCECGHCWVKGEGQWSRCPRCNQADPPTLREMLTDRDHQPGPEFVWDESLGMHGRWTIDSGPHVAGIYRIDEIGPATERQAKPYTASWEVIVHVSRGVFATRDEAVAHVRKLMAEPGSLPCKVTFDDEELFLVQPTGVFADLACIEARMVARAEPATKDDWTGGSHPADPADAIHSAMEDMDRLDRLPRPTLADMMAGRWKVPR